MNLFHALSLVAAIASTALGVGFAAQNQVARYVNVTLDHYLTRAEWAVRTEADNERRNLQFQEIRERLIRLEDQIRELHTH